MMRSSGDGTFVEVGRPSGSDLITNSRGVAVADFWNRGVMDIAVAASTDRHSLLKNEVGQRRNWLQVELTGTRSNRDAVGARLTVTIGDRHQTTEVFLGDSYGSQSTLRQHFGIGDATKIDELKIFWPASGIVQRFNDVQANQVVAVTEGDDSLNVRSFEVEQK
jgi:hypothetical protein